MNSENVHLPNPSLPVAKCQTITCRRLRLFLRRVIVLGAVLFASASGAATLVTTADTYSKNNEASTNFGTRDVLRVQNWANIATFADFDLSAISGSPVDIATLTIVTESNLKPGIVEIYRVAENWSESTLTHNNRPSLDPVPVATVFVSGLAAADEVTVDITPLVNGWLANPGSEFGLALVPTNVNLWARSRESGDGMSIDASTFLATPTPSNQLPQSGAFNVSVNPTLDLSCDTPDLDAAHFQISTSIDFSAPAYDSGSLESEICGHRASAGLDDISTYYWRGRQRSAAATWSEWSLATEFTTGDSTAVVANVFQDGTLAYTGTRDSDIRGSGSNPAIALRNWNQGGQDVLRTGRRPAGSSADEIYRTLLKFDISALTDSSAVNNAWIELTGWRHDDASHNRDVFGINKVYTINRHWGEGTGITRPPDPGEVSWLSSSSPDTWANPGAAFASDAAPGTDRASTPVVTHRSRNLEGLRAILSSNRMTELVRFWIDNPAENHGLILQAEDESILQVMNFAAREHTDPSFRPRIVVESTESAAVPTNQAPQVSAGADRNAVIGVQMKLDGNFTDDGLPMSPGLVTATWALVSGPGSISFVNVVDLESNVIFGSSGDYVLRLSADDGEFTSFDELTVSVSEASAMQSFDAIQDAYTRNNTPSSNYGSDIVVRVQKWANISTFARFDLTSMTSGTSSAQLELSVDSVLRDGTITVHKVLGDWNEAGLTELNKPQIGPALASRAFSSADDGHLVNIDITSLFDSLVASPGTDFGLALVTTNGNVRFDSREGGSAMQIHTTAGGQASNTPPQVDAGSNQQLLVSDVLALSGTVTDDGLPSPPTLTVLWSQVSGPASAAIINPTNVSTNVSFTTAGIYEFLLTASDSALSGSDSLFVDVLDPATNQPPVVSAGADRTTSVGVEITLVGSISDDGLPRPPGQTSSMWSVVTGPGNVILGSEMSTVTTANFDADGAYVLRLNADDGEFVRSNDVAVDVSEPAAAQTLTAIQDTYTRSNTATQNYGSETSIRVQKWADITGFIRFNLAAFPAGTSVSSATLRLAVSDVLKNGTFTVHRVLGDWSEHALNESNRPPLGAPAANFTVSGANAGQTVNVDVSTLFGDLLVDPATEFGIALSTGNGNLRLGSKESGSPILLDIETGLALPDVVGTLAFTDVTFTAGTAGPDEGGHGVMFADADNDGRPDLYLTVNFQNTGPQNDFFFRNQNGSVFAEEGQARGIEDLDGGSHGATWADLDNDGDYDLFNGTTWRAPEATIGFPDHDNVYENNGSGFFTDVTPANVQSIQIETRGVTAFDFDADGDLDLFGVPGREVPGLNEAFLNTGNMTFDIHAGVDLSTAIASQGVIDTNFDGDSDIDVLAANKNGDFAILTNNGAGNFTQVSPSSFGVAHSAGDGITTADVDNDGDLDILLVSDGTGQLYFRETGGTYVHRQTFTGVEGYMGGFADLDNDSDLDLVFAGDDEVFVNPGDGTFAAGPSLPTVGIDDPRAIAFADIDDDGDLDFAISAKRSRNWLVLNEFNAGNWLKIELVSPQGQAGAFGAITRVYPAGQIGGALVGMRESRSSYGYLAQDDPVLHFGLGSNESVDVVVDFVDGSQVTLEGVTANQIILIAP